MEKKLVAVVGFVAVVLVVIVIFVAVAVIGDGFVVGAAFLVEVNVDYFFVAGIATLVSMNDTVMRALLGVGRCFLDMTETLESGEHMLGKISHVIP